MPHKKSTLVYSTDHVVPGHRNEQKRNSPGNVLPSDVRAAHQKVTVRLDRKGRAGKSVTVIEGLRMSRQEREELLKEWKAMLGTGGAVRDAALEIQGDHCDVLMAALEKRGCRPKRSGG